jgi:hypothetical protein
VREGAVLFFGIGTRLSSISSVPMEDAWEDARVASARTVESINKTPSNQPDKAATNHEEQSNWEVATAL